MPNPPAHSLMNSLRTPRLQPLERALVLLALAIVFFIVNGYQAGNGDGHLELTNARANALIGNIAALLPMLFVFLALLARRSRGRGAALLLGIPIALLGLLTVAWQTCLGAEYERHTGKATDPPCRSIPMDGDATLNAYVVRYWSGTIAAVVVKQQIPLMPGLVWKRQIFWSSSASGCPEMKRQDGQNVSLTLPTDKDHPESKDTRQGTERGSGHTRTVLINVDDPRDSDAGH